MKILFRTLLLKQTHKNCENRIHFTNKFISLKIAQNVMNNISIKITFKNGLDNSDI